MAALSTLSDPQLMVLLKQGDAAALTEIHNRYYGILYNHAYRRFPFREEVRDIIQELFTYLWDQRESVSLTGSLPAYLYGAIRFSLFKVYRHQKVRSEYVGFIQDFFDEGENITEEQVLEKELVERIEKEVAALPPQMRLIFELSRNEELSHKEIAEKLGLSPHTVRTQVRSALRILKVKLGTYIFFIYL